MSAVPSRRRLLLAIAIGIAAGVLCTIAMTGANLAHPKDFEFWWRGARLWSEGGNPYIGRAGTASWPLPGTLLYPLPALVLMWPVHALEMPVAAGVFFGFSSGWLAWALSRDSLWKLWIFMSPGFFVALQLGQWSPLIMAGALMSGAAFVLTAKPSIGLACFLYRPTWKGALTAGAMFGLTVAIWPHWTLHWFQNVRAMTGHPAPVTTAAGALVLLGLLRWRQPEARLLVAMACVPQVMFFADQFPLMLVARTRLEVLALAAWGWAACGLWWLRWPDSNGSPYLHASSYVLVGCYLPALLLVLLRTDERSVRGAIRGSIRGSASEPAHEVGVPVLQLFQSRMRA